MADTDKVIGVEMLGYNNEKMTEYVDGKDKDMLDAAKKYTNEAIEAAIVSAIAASY